MSAPLWIVSATRARGEAYLCIPGNCKCPMRATALQRKVDKDGIASDGCFNSVVGH
jgi:hypothetical protein